MAINFKIIGVGGAGANVVESFALENFETENLAVIDTCLNTITLKRSVNTRLQIGKRTCKGLHTAGDVNKAKISAQENADEIKQMLTGCSVIFLIAGFGAGVGTGATSVIAKIAKEMNIETIVVATKPFDFEGEERNEKAMLGFAELKRIAKALIVIKNDGKKRDKIISVLRDIDNRIKYIVSTMVKMLNSNNALVSPDVNDFISVFNNETIKQFVSIKEHQNIFSKNKLFASVIDKKHNALFAGFTIGKNVSLDDITPILTTIKQSQNAEDFNMLTYVEENSLLEENEIDLTLITI